MLDGFNFCKVNGVLALNSAVIFNLTSMESPKGDARTSHSDVHHSSVWQLPGEPGLIKDEAQDLKSLLQLCLKRRFNSFWLSLPFLCCGEPKDKPVLGWMCSLVWFLLSQGLTEPHRLCWLPPSHSCLDPAVPWC